MHLAAGSLAYQRPTGQALGRAAVWTALAAMAGCATGDVNGVTAFIERLYCVGWREPDDDIWYVHLAMENPVQGLTWVLTGADTD